jgi:hypothetical protein
MMGIQNADVFGFNVQNVHSVKSMKNVIIVLMTRGNTNECKLQMRLWKLPGTAEHPIRRSKNSGIVMWELQTVLVTLLQSE